MVGDELDLINEVLFDLHHLHIDYFLDFGVEPIRYVVEPGFNLILD